MQLMHLLSHCAQTEGISKKIIEVEEQIKAVGRQLEALPGQELTSEQRTRKEELLRKEKIVLLEKVNLLLAEKADLLRRQRSGAPPGAPHVLRGLCRSLTVSRQLSVVIARYSAAIQPTSSSTAGLRSVRHSAPRRQTRRYCAA